MMEKRDLRAAAELNRRWNDGLAIFRAMPSQEAFFRSTASEILVRGGNRSGKSTAAAAKFAAIVRDKPIILKTGEEIQQRRPWQQGRPLVVWIIGLQLNHIGQTIYRLLFKSNLYKIILDQSSQRWRAFDPIADARRKHEARGSFPLIPSWEIQPNSWSWHLKAERQFSSVTLRNGTVIYTFASTADVKQGDPVDYIWIDEEIATIGHYAEWQARLSDVKGRIVWSSLSRSNPALIELTLRAQRQAEEVESGLRSEPDVEEFVLRFSANPYIEDDEKRKRLEGWSEDERLMRDEGEYIFGHLKIYPTFDKRLHSAIRTNEEDDDPLSQVLRHRKGEPPPNWTRYVILDPGTAKPAVLFCAVPPPSYWAANKPIYVVYDEIYEPRITAEQIAERVSQKSLGYSFQQFIIDGQAARQTPMGFGGTIGSHYSQAFGKRGLSSIETGTGFTPGDPRFESTSHIVQEWLGIQKNGMPLLRVVVERCPHFVNQMEGNLRAIKKGPNGEILPQDKPAPGQKDDLRQCLEYWASRGPAYIEPPSVSESVGGPGLLAYRRIQKMFRKESRPSPVVHAGPGEAV